MSPAAPTAPRAAGSLPFPNKPVGTVNTDMPFDHIIVVMMENHSLTTCSEPCQASTA